MPSRTITPQIAPALTLTVLLVALASVGAREETNRFFVNFTPQTAGQEEAPTAQQIEQARHAPQSRPSEQDPAGNWGPVIEGFQLSVRFAKEVFTNGEPVAALILLRNVTTKPLWYPISSGRDMETTCLLERNGQPVLRHDAIKPGASFAERLKGAYAGSEKFWRCPPGTQRPFQIGLSEFFDLTNGTYSVSVKRKVTNQARTDIAEVVSGPASFRIVAR
jgi:hypothetical protein